MAILCRPNTTFLGSPALVSPMLNDVSLHMTMVSQMGFVSADMYGYASTISD
jgi:hypothetical protein